ncbi:hypothetical protein B9Z55_012531 [Caenorhabditis nigoni]|uniref:DUF19 domain-containing protein n=2 Tax=Caenorhabditis nigoni TaxID=1611254 RepID=A0A2G5TY76_9PELO|nr:hypothetical protein B9Z55_012531 [Caenorhabditis nigoni]
MFKFLTLFFVLAVFSVSAGKIVDYLLNMPIKNGCFDEHRKVLECVEPHEPIINLLESNIQPPSIYNIGLMRKVLQVSKNVSECIGKDLKCDSSRLVTFALNAGGYVGDKMYGDAFHCFINAQVPDVMENCTKEVPHPSELYNTTLVAENKNEYFECIAQQLYKVPSCKIGRIVDLYKAGHAAVDSYIDGLRFVVKGDPAGLNFDELKYCDI